MMTETDERFMKICLELARRGLGWTSPNPLVGCVIVHEGEIIARGAHLRDGMAHAEQRALLSLIDPDFAKKAGGGDAAGEALDNDNATVARMLDNDRIRNIAEGATLYVNLEPCSHQGRTPPCTEKIIAAGISRVVWGDKDSDLRSSGKAKAILESAGIEVQTGILHDECRRLNDRFHHWHKHNRPFVALKMAVSLDGKIALADGQSKWITNEMSRAYVGLLRQEYDAVLVGEGTLQADNPRLTVRKDEIARFAGEIAGFSRVDFRYRSPCAIALSREGKLEENSAVLAAERQSRTEKSVIVVTKPEFSDAVCSRLKLRDDVAVLGIRHRPTDGGYVVWDELFARLPEFGIYSVLVEGGAAVWTDLIRQGKADKYYVFVAPKFLGSDSISAVKSLELGTLEGAPQMEIASIKRLGGDLLVEAYPRHN